MGSAIPQQRLAEIVSEAQTHTGVPAVTAGLLVDEKTEFAAAGPVEIETPFRIASITKWFTASLAALLLDLEAPAGPGGENAARLLSHTADLRQNSRDPLPEPCRGLWSYSNAGFVFAGDACAMAAGTSYSAAVQELLLDPLGLESTGFEQPESAAQGRVPEADTGHRPAPEVVYAERRRAAGGLWSTVGDLLRFAAHQLGGSGPLTAAQLRAVRKPRADALGGRYCLGCWSRELDGGRLAFDHEGSVGGYQSLLLLVPEENAALAVLTNSWRGSGLIRRVVRELGLVPAALDGPNGVRVEPGRYELDDLVADVADRNGRLRVAESETDPLTGVRIERPEYAVDALGGDVYGFAGGLLMSHRLDFPREGVARVGWTALPAASS
jgi:CubicO group peptidase (beta-lactamase class C family)